MGQLVDPLGLVESMQHEGAPVHQGGVRGEEMPDHAGGVSRHEHLTP